MDMAKDHMDIHQAEYTVILKRQTTTQPIKSSSTHAQQYQVLILKFSFTCFLQSSQLTSYQMKFNLKIQCSSNYDHIIPIERCKGERTLMENQ
jgi:hypothetical protein